MHSTARASAGADVELQCAVIDAYAEGITSLREVSRLHLSFLQPSMFPPIASLARLLHLTLDLTHCPEQTVVTGLEPRVLPDSELNPTTPPLLCSPTLEHLHIRTRQWTRLIDTLYHIGDAPLLHTLSISTSASAPDADESSRLSTAMDQLLARTGVETFQHCRVDFEYSAGSFHSEQASPLDGMLDSLGDIPHVTDLGMKVVFAEDVVLARKFLVKVFGVEEPEYGVGVESGCRWRSLRGLRLYQGADGFDSLFDVEEVRMLRARRPWVRV